MSDYTCKHGHDEFSTGKICPECVAEQKAVERAAQQAKWNADREVENARLRQRNKKVYDGIIAAVVASGHKADLRGDRGDVLFVEDVNVSYYIDIKEEYTSSTWRAHPTGRLRVAIGNYGNRTSYPSRKDGSFNYEAMANGLVNAALTRKAMEKAQKFQSANEQVADQLRAELGIKRYWNAVSFDGSTEEVNPIKIKFNLDRAVTKERAIEIYNGLKALGLAE